MSSLIAFIMYKVQRRDRLKDEAKSNETVLSLMVRGLCHDKIIYLTDKYTERGGLTRREKSNLQALYNPYRQGGGNGDCKIGFEACEELPIISEAEARARDLERKRHEILGVQEGEQTHA